MPIPLFDTTGLLPGGLHDGTLEEVESRFAKSPPRRVLWEQFVSYAAEIRRWPIAKELIVDGSFVTDEPAPHDIDVILVLRDDYDLSKEVSPFEYNLRSHRMVSRRYGLDLFAVRPGSLEYNRFIQLFSQVRDRGGRTKGLIRIEL